MSIRPLPPPVLLAAALLLALPLPSPAALPLPRSTPEAQSISSQSILDFVNAVDQIHTLHSFMIVRHGNVIAEGWWSPEAPDKPHVLWSLSKRFNSTAVGLAIADGGFLIDSVITQVR